MKKIFALALAIVMMMAIALPVFAAAESAKYSYGNVDVSDAPASQRYNDATELKYGVSQTYTVVIPEDIAFNSQTLTAERTVSILDAVIAGNEKIKVNVVSKHGWQMVDYQDGTIDAITEENPAGPSDAVNYWYGVDAAVEEGTYTIGDEFEGTGPIIDEAPVAGNNGLKGRDKTVTLYFGTRGTAQEGTYKDYLTFVVDVYEVQ